MRAFPAVVRQAATKISYAVEWMSVADRVGVRSPNGEEREAELEFPELRSAAPELRSVEEEKESLLEWPKDLSRKMEAIDERKRELDGEDE